ncbi:MAG TPA: carbohydrate porin [Chlamydiales bacterium]|nr:carbohydrate porin [Chlamydiales bacterium]
MNRNILILLILYLPLLASDHRHSQSALERHTMLLEYFQEEHPTENWWDRKYFFGDTHLRHQLAHYGITIASSYVTNLLGNPVGGKEQDFAYDGSFGISANIDFTHAGLTGFNLYSAMAWRTGDNLSREIDNQFTVSQIYGSETVRLAQLYIWQTLFCKRLTFKLGRLCAGDDFLSSPLYWQFVNNAFDGNPVSIFFNIPFSAYPGATWGAYVEGLPWDWLLIKAGVFNANTEIQKNKYHGVNFTFKSTNGVVWITEWCVRVNPHCNDDGLPGNYKVGFYYLTGSRDQFSGNSERGDPGLYVLLDQTIYQPDCCRSLTPFISFLWQPENRNLFPYFINGGLVYRGPFESRPKDVAAFGVVWGRYSPDLDRVQRKNHIEPQIAEIVLELNYSIQLNQWMYVMPDMQYIIHPKGRDRYPNAWVLGAQISIDAW